MAVKTTKGRKDPTRNKTKQLLTRLAAAKREEDVKAAWARCFALEYDTADDHDLYTEQVLFEFKHQRNFDQPAQRATTLAQLLYYVRRLKLGGTAKGIPANFEQALVVHAVRRLPKAEWHNDRDQFMQPSVEPLPAEFVADCVV